MFIHRLDALAVPVGILRDVLEFILPVVRFFALQATEVVGGTNRLPPRAFGVCACVRACVVTGWLNPQDLRPESVSPEAWDSSLNVDVNGDLRDAPGDLPAVTVEALAEAACCGLEDVRNWTFDLMNEISLAIQEVQNGM